MPTKKKTSTKAKSASVKLKGRSRPSRPLAKTLSPALGRFVLPLIIICVLLGCVVFFGVSGYRVATASGFFGLRSIDIYGAERTSADDVRRTVAASVEKPGVWNADLSDIRAKVEKFPFVKSAAVSMVLPAGIRVNIIERVPAAIVHLGSGDYLIDGEGAVLTAATANDKDFPFILRGWDEAKTEKAVPENLARLKLYRKMLDEWKQYDLASHVKEVNLANPREPSAVIEDSGRAIPIVLNKEDLGKSLRRAIEAVTGKGAKIRSVDAGGIYPLLQYMD
jgi:cell division septal protein FtsQ